MAKPRIYPIPEALVPGVWQVREDAQPRVDTTKRVMYIPIQADQQHAMVRAHEMSHVAFTGTRKIPKHLRSNMIFQAVEDYRIHKHAEDAGVPINTIGFPVAELELAALQSAGNFVRYVELLLSVPRCNLGIITSALSEDEHLEDAEKSYITDEIIAPAKDLMHARSVKHMRRVMGHNRSGAPWTFKRAIAVAEWIIARIPQQGKAGTGTGYPDNYVPHAQWGKLEMETPALTHNPIKRGKVTRAIDHGAVMVRPDRFASDLRVFSEVLKRKQSGTVLIDTSGSMSLSPEDVATMVRDMPAGTIAVYGSNSPRGTVTGQLRIIARNGKMLNPSDPLMSVGGGNVIDGPALDWLARQQRPRIWVCDGHVTGKRELQSQALEDDAKAIVRLGSIAHVNPLLVDSVPVAVSGKLKKAR